MQPPKRRPGQSTPPPLPAATPHVPLALASDPALLAALRAHVDGPASVVFAFRERRLRMLIATLSHAETRALLVRFSRPQPLPGDALAGEFRRLIPERRARILDALRDQPRRLALAAAPAR